VNHRDCGQLWIFKDRQEIQVEGAIQGFDFKGFLHGGVRPCGPENVQHGQHGLTLCMD
jgi:hypothetical protein